MSFAEARCATQQFPTNLKVKSPNSLLMVQCPFKTFDKEKLLSKINGALDRMKWRSELFYLVNPLPDSKVVVESLERALNHQR